MVLSCVMVPIHVFVLTLLWCKPGYGFCLCYGVSYAMVLANSVMLSCILVLTHVVVLIRVMALTPVKVLGCKSLL